VQLDELVADSLPPPRAFAVGSHRLDRLDMLLDRLVRYRTYRVGEKVRDDTKQANAEQRKKRLCQSFMFKNHSVTSIWHRFSFSDWIFFCATQMTHGDNATVLPHAHR
jgi:hypothetical protein